MNLEEIKEERKKIYKDFENLEYDVNKLTLNCFEDLEKSKNQLDIFLHEFGSGCQCLSLPSGRKGNVLALAIEMQKFDIAKHIALSGLVRTDEVSCDENDENCKSAIDHVRKVIPISKKEDRENLYELLTILREKNREVTRLRLEKENRS